MTCAECGAQTGHYGFCPKVGQGLTGVPSYQYGQGFAEEPRVEDKDVTHSGSLCHELRRVSDDKLIAYLHERPPYCDRGRWRQGIEVQVWRSENDPAPRYYFNLEAGKAETEAYLKAKKVDLQGTSWVERRYT